VSDPRAYAAMPTPAKSTRANWSDVGNAFDPWYAGHRPDHRVVSKIDHIEESCGEVRGEQLPAVVVDGEVPEDRADRSLLLVAVLGLHSALTGPRGVSVAGARRRRWRQQG
jgi:hypothetical protein